MGKIAATKTKILNLIDRINTITEESFEDLLSGVKLLLDCHIKEDGNQASYTYESVDVEGIDDLKLKIQSLLNIINEGTGKNFTDLTQGVAALIQSYVGKLGYELSSNGTYYICNGIGQEDGNEVEIASEILGTPVREIEDDAFRDCSNITSIKIPDSIRTIGHGAFAGCSNLASIVIPYSVSDFGDSLFAYCSNLKEVILPDGQYDLSESMFEACSSLENVNIPNDLRSIREYAFKDCSSLKNINIPVGIADIEHHAFYGCSSLTSFKIPDNIKTISEELFGGCSNLASIIIPEGVNTIDAYAFNGCTSLEKVYYKGTEAEWLNVYIDPMQNEAIENATIYYYAEEEPTYIVGTVYNYWHYGESGEILIWGHVHEYSTRVVEPTCTGWGYTQYDCACLYSYSGDYINPTGHAFGDWNITLAADCVMNGLRQRTCVKCNHTEKEVLHATGHNYIASVIPPTCTENGCTKHTCSNCGDSYKTLETEMLGHVEAEAVEENRKEATCTEAGFYESVVYCSRCGDELSRTKVTIPATGHKYKTTVKKPTHDYIPKNDEFIRGQGYTTHTCEVCGHSYKDSYTDYYSEGLEFKKDDANNCYEVKGIGSCTDDDIAIPAIYDGLPVKAVGSYAFADCSNAIYSIYLPDSITTIKNDAFRGMTYLDGVHLGNGVESIFNYAFKECYGLEKINIPNSVTTIGKQAFYDCIRLPRITIPVSVTKIGDSAFYSVTKPGDANGNPIEIFQKIYYEGTKAQWKAIDKGDNKSTYFVYDYSGTYISDEEW